MIKDPIINIQCGQTSIIRHTGLIPPPAARPLPPVCTYRINAISFQICQMRLEFRQFTLAGPTVNPLTIGPAFQKCNDEHLTVSVGANVVTTFALCGENAGQHSKLFKLENDSNAFTPMITCQFMFQSTRDKANDISQSQSPQMAMATPTPFDPIGILRCISLNVLSDSREFSKTHSCRHQVVSTKSSELPERSFLTGLLQPAACNGTHNPQGKSNLSISTMA